MSTARVSVGSFGPIYLSPNEKKTFSLHLMFAFSEIFFESIVQQNGFLKGTANEMYIASATDKEKQAKKIRKALNVKGAHFVAIDSILNCREYIIY